MACKTHAQAMDSSYFKSEKVSKTSTISLNATIDKTFPLFGAFEERKWANGWKPHLIYPSTEIIEEGTTFKTNGHGHSEKEFIWRVSKYDPEKHLIQYLVSTENRYWTITVKCSPAADHKTKAEITYSFIGLTALGNEINKHSLEAMYKENLNDWQDNINYYLANGKAKSN